LKQGTKQRIVGSVVLLAVALIFLPIIFDGQGSYSSPVTSRIPAQPTITVFPEPLQTRPVILADSEAIEIDTAVSTDNEAEVEAAAEPDAVAVVTSQPAFTRQTPSLDSAGLPQGWSVRLGSFSDASNASNLVARLQAAGYKAYSRRIDNAQGELTGVYVGPWLERSIVEEYQQRLQEEFQLAGIIVSYEIQQL
jgi:DedD protein